MMLLKHLLRAPAKLLLGLAVAFLFTLTLGVLQNNIASLDAEIDRLYSETIVTAELRMAQDFARSQRIIGDNFPMLLVGEILALEFMGDYYMEAGGLAFVKPHELPDHNLATINVLASIQELRYLTEEPEGFLSRDDSREMAIEFAPGFGCEDFSFTDGDMIPAIFCAVLAQERGIQKGDTVQIMYYSPVMFRPSEWLYTDILVIGLHDSHGLPRFANLPSEVIVMPLAAKESLLGGFTGFLTFRFTINPAYNRQLDDIRNQLDSMLAWTRYPWRDLLAADIWDQELRFGVAALTNHVALLRVMFPVAVAVATIIGIGFALLLILQSAKIAAIMRVLGVPRQKAFAKIWAAQVAVCAAGALLGFAATLALGLRDNLPIIVLPYIIGAIIGAAIGAYLVTSRAPIELLQVRE